MGTGRSDYDVQTDYEVMVRVKSFMPKSERSFREWAQRINLPERVSFYDDLKIRLSLADLAITAGILKCCTDELLYRGTPHQTWDKARL